MKRLIKAIVLLLVAAVVVIVGGAYLLPGQVRVERATLIDAAPEAIYPLVGDLKRFNEWSPWATLDPATQYSFEGPEKGGTGQKMSWASNNPQVGKGSQTIREAVANAKVVIDLDMGEMGTAVSTMQLKPVDGGTVVTWSFSSELNGVMERWMGLMFDRWIGADYGNGLANLKRLAEKPAQGG